MDDIGTTIRKGKELWKKSVKVSADEISANANLKRLYTQRRNYRCENWKGLAANYEKSVFYQLDLQDAANEFVHLDLETPDILKEDAAPMVRIHNRMLRARIMKLRGNGEWQKEEQAAFQLLRDGLLGAMSTRKIIRHSAFIPIKSYGDVALSELTWQEDGRIHLLILFIREEVLSISPLN